jgi:NADPH2:quinone reductase
MKALLSVRPGGPETLELHDVASPEPGAGQLRLRVIACGVNYPDVLVIEDRYQFKPPRPFAPGSEITGTVDAVGSGVTGWAKGDRVIAIIPYGGMSEEILLDAAHAIRLPDGRDPVEGAGLIFTYATSLHGLADRGRLQAGETLLVLGAAGGVGLAAVEIGKALGARVVAGVSSAAKAEAAKAAGADVVFLYPRGPFDRDAAKALAETIRQAVGGAGADVVYDPVGGDYTQAALRSIAWEGRYLVVGFPAGIPELPLNLTLLKSCDVRGVFWGAFAMRDPKRNAEHVGRLMTWWSEGRIRPRIDTVVPLADGGEAIRRLASRSVIGKIVVATGGDRTPL